MANEMQRSSSRKAASSAQQKNRLPYSAESFERVDQLVGADWVAHHADLEDQLTEKPVVADKAAVITASQGRVSIPMAEPRSRPRERPRKNAPKRPIEIKWRMAYCAAVTLYDEEGTSIFHCWKSRLRVRNRSADEILHELRTSGCERRCRDSKQPVHEAIIYLEDHRDRMFPSSAGRQHLPIGIGSAEATRETLVTMRMKRPGTHWKEQAGEQTLKLRALACSDRWGEGMNLLLARRRTAVRAAT